jgi:hypothetical protein
MECGIIGAGYLEIDMAAQSLKLAGREFVIIPRKEYARLEKLARLAPKVSKRAAGSTRAARASHLPSPEQYTDQRVAEFILSNSVDAPDYVRACRLVRKMGLDPAHIDHDRPAGVKQ